MLNTLFGYSLFALFIFLGMHYSLSVLLSTVIGIIFNFKTIGLLVFKNKNNSLLIKFVTVYVITYCLNVGLLHIFKENNFNMYLAGFLLLFPIALISFLLHNSFVFREKKAI
ncbi:MAG: polysaccharide biosynthesis protein, GtrA family [Geobacteraceae bacterium]|nr:polysaccharide biosynthesis protein, GtrA family [Geobacteraceae bacterium]